MSLNRLVFTISLTPLASGSSQGSFEWPVIPFGWLSADISLVARHSRAMMMDGMTLTIVDIYLK
jgi:hypothetical protein